MTVRAAAAPLSRRWMPQAPTIHSDPTSPQDAEARAPRRRPGIGGAIYGIANLTLTGSAFTGNTASGNTSAAGGAVTCANCYLTSDSFTLNSATGTGAAGAASTGAAGGALYATTGSKIQSSSLRRMRSPATVRTPRPPNWRGNSDDCGSAPIRRRRLHVEHRNGDGRVPEPPQAAR